jgi:hypothetical protein
MEGTPEGRQGAGCRFFADFLWTSKESQAHHEIVCGAQPRVMGETFPLFTKASSMHEHGAEIKPSPPYSPNKPPTPEDYAALHPAYHKQ